MTLADRIADVLVEQGPLPVCVIATTLRRRKSEVIVALGDNPDRFAHNGLKARASRWHLADDQNGFGQDGFDQEVPSFDATALLALHPDWSRGWAEEVIGWLVEVGFAASLNGNGTVYATDTGEHLSRDFGVWWEVTS